MYTVLVADDSALDRHLAAQLIHRAGAFAVRFAADGTEALQSIRAHPPDLVLADLQMPGLDGLQLVEAVRELNPGVPLVLMTGHGSEEIAVRALHRGAASYVPKRVLADRLADTLTNVLELARKHEARRLVFEWMTSSESNFVIGNDRHAMAPIVDHLIGDLRRTGQCDETRLLQLAVALREALSNAIYHGNLEVASSLRTGGYDAFEAIANQRRSTPPYCHRKVHIRALQTRLEVSYTIRDEGRGFDASTLPDALSAAALESASGRGLLLIQSFLDEVRFNALGNEITMLARLSTEPAARVLA